MTGTAPSVRRARRAFWTLTAAAILTMGVLSAALGASTGQGAATVVAASGLLLVVLLGLATRVLLALERAARRSRPQ